MNIRIPSVQRIFAGVLIASLAGCVTMPPPAGEDVDITAYEMAQSWDIDSAPRAFALDPGGRFALMSFIGSPGDPTITWFDLQSGAATTIEAGKSARASGEAKAIAIAPDGSEFAASWPGVILLIDTGTQDVSHTVAHEKGNELLYFNDVSYSPDGSRIAGIAGEITWLDPVTGGFVAEEALPPGGGRKLSALGPDTVIAGLRGSTRVIRAGQAEPVCEFDFPVPGDVQVSGDGSKLAIAYRGGFSIRQADDCSEISNWKAEGFVPTVAWLPDGRHLAAASLDGAVRFWDTQTGTLAHTLPAHSDGLVLLAMSDDGRTLLTVSGRDDKQVKAWTAP